MIAKLVVEVGLVSCKCRAGFDQDLHTADKPVNLSTIVHVVRLEHAYIGVSDCAVLFGVGGLCTAETGDIRLKK